MCDDIHFRSFPAVFNLSRLLTVQYSDSKSLVYEVLVSMKALSLLAVQYHVMLMRLTPTAVSSFFVMKFKEMQQLINLWTTTRLLCLR